MAEIWKNVPPQSKRALRATTRPSLPAAVSSIKMASFGLGMMNTQRTENGRAMMAIKKKILQNDREKREWLVSMKIRWEKRSTRQLTRCSRPRGVRLR